MELIDKRAIPLSVTFGDLKIGDAFQDEDGDVCIKVNHNAIIWTDGDRDWQYAIFDAEELIIPLKATITVERGVHNE